MIFSLSSSGTAAATSFGPPSAEWTDSPASVGKTAAAGFCPAPLSPFADLPSNSLSRWLRRVNSASRELYASRRASTLLNFPKSGVSAVPFVSCASALCTETLSVMFSFINYSFPDNFDRSRCARRCRSKRSLAFRSFELNSSESKKRVCSATCAPSSS